MSRFPKPETTVLTLKNGDTITVRRRLNAGETRAAYARMYLAGVDGTLRANPLQTGIARCTAFLLDWSLTDDDGKPVVIRGVGVEELTSALDSLDMESFVEIREAIEAHEAAQLTAREQEKKDPAGATSASAISSSPSAAAGASSGSAP